jgi:hypothetical protein
MMLQMLQKLCEKEGIQFDVAPQDIKSLTRNTDPHRLMQDLQNKLPSE